MKVSTKGKYAVQLMVDITLHNAGSCIALKDVSRRQNISVKYLEQVVGALTERCPGTSGGIQADAWNGAQHSGLRAARG